ncbi:class I SAM-dependent methyltransferase [Candidatus Woesearchaeota archaeon]|nr:class I SAM-dependent methyltransferase [Candidatus Woesearchaeota archaeon]
MDEKELIKQHYERDNPWGMFNPSKIWGKLKRKQLKYVMKFMGSGKKVLDIACGPGVYSVAAAKKGNSVFAIDCASNMVEAARKYSKSQGVDVKIDVGDASSLDFEDSSFDTVLFIDVSHHLSDLTLEKIYSEIYRVLKPGGVLITDYKNKSNIALRLSYYMHSKKEFQLIARDYRGFRRLLKGYKIIDVKGIGFMKPYVNVVAKKC